jgi:uncharacterized coiled-coil protein SlyX
MFGHVTNIKSEYPGYGFGLVKDTVTIEIYERTNLMPGHKVEITPKHFENNGGFYPCKNNETIKELNEKLKQKESTIEQFKKEVEYWQSKFLCKKKYEEKPIEKLDKLETIRPAWHNLLMAEKINELIDKVNSLSKG